MFYNRCLSPQRWLDRAGVGTPMRIVIGLVLLMTCVLLFAKAFRLFPGAEEAELRRRTTIAEMAAIQIAVNAAQDDQALVRRLLEEMVRRYDGLKSACLLRDGSAAIATSDHARHWAGALPQISTPTHLRVMLSDKQKPWGELQIAFAPMPQYTTWYDWWSQTETRLKVFILAGSFVLFWFYLSRMLTMLDPSSVIPDRMQLLMDTLVEGMVILDENERIVMANQSFANTAFSSVDRLIGQKLSSLPWRGQDGAEANFHPWNVEESRDLQQRGVPMQLLIGARHARRLNVNASPILAADGTHMGMVVTFADQTVIEADNLHMSQFVSHVTDAAENIRRLQEDLRSHDPELRRFEEMARAVRELAELCHTAPRDTLNPSAPAIATEPAQALTNPNEIRVDLTKGTV